MTLAVAAGVLLRANRDQWFFKDEWVFFRELTADPPASVWTPHNGHWSTVPMLVYRALFDLVHLSSYRPYIAVLLLVHLVAVHLAWRLFQHAGAGIAASTVLAAILAVLGSGAENLLWAFQIGFVGSVAVVLAVTLVLDRPRPGPGRLAVGSGLAVASLLFSGISVPLLVLPAVVGLARAGVRRTVATFAAPVVAYLAWLLLAPPNEGDSFPRPGVGEGVHYVAAGLLDAVGSASGLGPLAGPLVLLAAVVVAVVLRRGRSSARTDSRPEQARAHRALVAGSALAVLGLYVVVAVGRGSLGVGQAGESRYVYIAAFAGAPAVAGLLAVVLTWRRPVTSVVLSGLALTALVTNGAALADRVAVETARETTTREAVAATVEILRTGEPTLAESADPLSEQTLPSLIGRLDRAGDFGGGLPTPPADRLAATRLRIQFATVRGPAPAASRPLAVQPVPGTATRPDGPCRAFTRDGDRGPAQLLLSTDGGPGAVTIRPPHSGFVTVDYLPGPDDVLAVATRTVPVYVPGATTLRWLGRAGSVRLTLTGPGATVACPPGRDTD